MQLKLSCSIALNDTVALEAAAFLATPEGGNRTVAGVEWAEIPLPGVGQ